MIDKIDASTTQQIYEFLNHEAFTNPIAIMPDTHAGAGAVIGFTMQLGDKVIPNVIGVDINCGMTAMNFGPNLFNRLNRQEFDYEIRQLIPFGTNVRGDKQWLLGKNQLVKMYKEMTAKVREFTMKFNKVTGRSALRIDYGFPEINDAWFQKKCEDIGMDYKRAIASIGTLGSGNHFIEAGVAQLHSKDYWVTVHSGSRQFGLKVAKYHQKKAGKGALAYLEGEDMFNYLIDMVVAGHYAHWNREYMCYFIWTTLDREMKESIETVHNFIDFDDFIIRKGAVASYEGRKMIIPFNMQDGLLICEGKSNAEWNYSAPHGAGRLGSRRWAKETLSKKDAEKAMKDADIYCSKLPLDECKGAYKDPATIEKYIAPTADIIERIKPVLAMKD
jgi:RNA-splicing ligase RtcB